VMMMRAVVFLLLLGVFAIHGERLGEHGHGRVHDHHHEEFEEFEDDIVEEDDHRGIPVVEDDVPEWVKLTFADKFIALGEIEFLAYGEDLDPAEFEKEVDDDRATAKFDDEDEDEGSYEYVYSDEEGFEFDPDRDILINDPKKRQLESEDEEHDDDDAVVYEEDSEGQEHIQLRPVNDQNDQDVELAATVRKHRSRVSAPPVAIPLNTPPSPAWTKPVQDHVADALSLLQVEEAEARAPSHSPGSRRANRGRPGVRVTAGQGSTQPPQHQQAKYQIPARYNGGAKMNKNDPRLKPVPSDVPMSSATAFVEERVWLEGEELPLMKDSQHVAKNHKKWLEENGEKEVELPSLKKHMYANGLPVAEWEVGYVDNVLKQFGY